MRRDVFGEIIETPQLADQVEMGRALVMAATIGGRLKDRQRATVVGDLVLEVFANHDKGGFLQQGEDRREGQGERRWPRLVRQRPGRPVLAELAALTGEAKYREGRAQCDRVLHARDRQARARGGGLGARGACAVDR
jgi:hypothetical protein